MSIQIYSYERVELDFFSLPLLYEADFSVSHNKVLRVAQVAVGSSTAAVLLLLRWRFSHKIMEVENKGICSAKNL